MVKMLKMSESVGMWVGVGGRCVWVCLFGFGV